MISIILRHYLYDVGINAFFDAVIANFATYDSLLGKYVFVYDNDDGSLLTFGKVTEANNLTIIVDKFEAEFIVDLGSCRVVVVSEYECDALEKQIDDGLLEYVSGADPSSLVTDETIKDWLNTR